MLAKTPLLTLLGFAATAAAVAVPEPQRGSPAYEAGYGLGSLISDGPFPFGLRPLPLAPIVLGPRPPRGPPPGPPQGYNGPPPGYNGPPQGYNGPPPGYNGPPQGYNGPPRGSDGPPPRTSNGPPPPGASNDQIDRYCASLDVATSQLPPNCATFCAATQSQPWWC